LNKVVYENLKSISYREIWDIQSSHHQALIAQKMALRNDPTIKLEIPHKIFFCEHNPVYTLGKSGDISNLLLSEQDLNNQNIEFHKINRGGDITYHGPGQITGYPILDMDFIYNDIHRYVREMEEAIIKTLDHFGIKGDRINGYTGVWIQKRNEDEQNRKICAIGVHMSRWVTLHGFALNVDTDLTYFDKIIPCGISDNDKSVTSMSKELSRTIHFDEVAPILLSNLTSTYGLVL
jgi:lipoyl(octanoyl) transferase